jgi:ABC-type glycerol-3-phosphate transport system permease component
MNKGLFPVPKLNRIAISFILWGLALVWVFPIYSAISKSLKGEGFNNYIRVLTMDIGGVYFIQATLNSFIIAFIAIVLTCSISALSGFCFSKIKFSFKNIIFFSTLCLLAMPGVTIMVPLFFTLKKLNLINTFFSVAFPQAALTLPFGVLMMRNAFDSFPNEYMDSGAIDGANIFQIFYMMYLPLCKPALINLAILQFVWSFQDFLLPMFLLTKNSLMTATVLINTFNRTKQPSPRDFGAFSAGLILLGVPILLTFLFFSKYIKRGIISGSIKG